MKYCKNGKMLVLCLLFLRKFLLAQQKVKAFGRCVRKIFFNFMQKCLPISYVTKIGINF